MLKGQVMCIKFNGQMVHIFEIQVRDENHETVSDPTFRSVAIQELKHREIYLTKPSKG